MKLSTLDASGVAEQVCEYNDRWTTGRKIMSECITKKAVSKSDQGQKILARVTDNYIFSIKDKAYPMPAWDNLCNSYTGIAGLYLIKRPY